MKTDKLTYLVIENAPDVCEGIIRRMDNFDKWESLGYCTGVKESIQKIKEKLPNLLYLDWSLNGGSAFEILQQVENIAHYNPYIIFNTGFQKDNPEIPQEIINTYMVDKYLVKPFWENLRTNLPIYLKQAEEKVNSKKENNARIWIEDYTGSMVQIILTDLICICQHPNEPRCRIFYFEPALKEIIISLQWHRCYSLLESGRIDYFVTKNRSHLVTRTSIEKFDRPFVRLKNFPAKIEVVKESLKEFESWLIKK